MVKKFHGKPELMGYKWLFLIFMGLEYRNGRSNVSAWGSTLRGVEFFLFLIICYPVLFIFLCIFFSCTSHIIMLTIPNETFCMYCFFSPRCYHTISRVTISTELSIPVRGRPWGKNRYPYQAFLCVLPASIVLRNLKREDGVGVSSPWASSLNAWGSSGLEINIMKISRICQ